MNLNPFLFVTATLLSCVIPLPYFFVVCPVLYSGMFSFDVLTLKAKFLLDVLARVFGTSNNLASHISPCIPLSTLPTSRDSDLFSYIIFKVIVTAYLWNMLFLSLFFLLLLLWCLHGYFCFVLCLPVAGSLDAPIAADTLTPRTADGSTLATEVFDQFSANITEHRTHEGYLYKRGALLKGWKQRWFVLDSMKHQVWKLHMLKCGWQHAGMFFPHLAGEFVIFLSISAYF